MKTMKLIQLCSMVIMLLFSSMTYSQSLGDVIKKEAEKVAEKIDGKKKKKKKKKSSNEEVVAKPVKNFIAGNIIFADDFNLEKEGEFPSKWTHISGTIQNTQMVTNGKKHGVMQFYTSGSVKPSISYDSYLGKSFKIEGLFHFDGKGNESYTLNLMNSNDPYRAYQITIRGDGIVPAGSSSEYSRMPNKMTYPGWRTVQVSFNSGTLKVFYDGVQLINNPSLKKTNGRVITEFTHLEVSALASMNNKAMIDYLTIGNEGLPLYKKLMTDGRIIFYDILFDNDSYFIKPSSYSAIDRIVSMMNDNPGVSIQIEGHTDSNGSKESNQILSENRAKSVMHYIINKGVNKKRLRIVGYGEERPIDTSDNEAAWAKNRRVEIVKF
ncbi:OmpA family protein [Winogradskyella sp. 3972H.M.0a.05]|uniref:OmpA family protein n=1 Tax=Winogradskyella sp. 3972H.M.0a.05 TaxID=2950277 RepID=UPI003396DD6D